LGRWGGGRAGGRGLGGGRNGGEAVVGMVGREDDGVGKGAEDGALRGGSGFEA